MDIAFASIAFGDAVSFCVCAVLGERLKRLDSQISRVLVTDSESLFKHDLVRKTWRVVQAAPLYMVSPIIALKIYLWALPFRRVVYLDADNFPLQLFNKNSLQYVWALNLNSTVLGSPQDGRGEGCFNGGFLVLQPNNVHFQNMRALIQRHPTRSGIPPSETPRCHILDQMFLNFFFKKSWYDIKHRWVVNSFYRCHGMANSFHMFRDTRPWKLDCGDHLLSLSSNKNTPYAFSVCKNLDSGQRCCSSFGSVGRRGRTIHFCKTAIEQISTLWWQTFSQMSHDLCLPVFQNASFH